MNSDQHQSIGFKKTLLTTLLDGVKGCQSRFGSRTELATEDDESVARLCGAYEDVFSHGFQKTVQQPSSAKTSFWVPAAFRASNTCSFWPLIKSQLSKHEAERFILLHNVRTDAGRCRAWIRASLNEHSLERYILIILSLENLHDFYHDWAFLRDHELNSILSQTAAGLGSVFFALNVDSPNLDSLVPVTRVMEKDVPEATSVQSTEDTVEIADQAIIALSPNSLVQGNPSVVGAKSSQTVLSSTEDKNRNKSCKKRRRKPPVNFVSFDDDEDHKKSLDNISAATTSTYYSLPTTASTTPTEKKVFNQDKELEEAADKIAPSSTTMNDSVPSNVNAARNMSESGYCNNDNVTRDFTKDSENESSDPSMDAPHGTAQSVGDPCICSTSVKSADCISVNSVYSDCSERLDLETVSLSGLEISPSQRLKPIVNDLSSSTIKSGGYRNPDFSGDLIPVPSYDSSLAPDLHLEVHNTSTCQNHSKIHSPATPITPGCTALSKSNDFGTSAEVVAVKNDEALQKLKAILDREVETVATLRADLAEERRSSNNHIKILEAKIESLCKENEILRHQLKKYVGAVQLLKREGSRRFSLQDDDDDVLNSCPENHSDDFCQEAAEYERKLIQVAEMHGELMEFNSHLQKTIQRKDASIKRLREELIDLRGPLASLGGDEDEDDDSWDIVESFSSENRSRTAALTARRLANSHSNERVLINIWIPSAFLTGATNDLHHVYQVFLRIKDTEWNIYRRYSQFYSLHRDLSKNNPVVSSLYFPPKKHLGNKDAKFVDERRRKLQEYLRTIMNHTLQTNSILASHPEKNLLISILPFFGESFNTQTQKPKRERSRTRNLFFRQSGQSNQSQSQGQPLQFSNYPQYTGL